MNTVLYNPINPIRRGVELSQGVDGIISLPGIALAAAGLMYLGKKAGDYLNKQIGVSRTAGIAIFGLLATLTVGGAAMLFESVNLALTAGALASLSVGLTMSNNREIKRVKKKK